MQIICTSSDNGLYACKRHVADLKAQTKLLTKKLLKQGYLYHKLRKTFCKFHRRYYDLISKFQVGLKSLLYDGVSKP